MAAIARGDFEVLFYRYALIKVEVFVWLDKARVWI
jgi:hypothetical protein